MNFLKKIFDFIVHKYQESKEAEQLRLRQQAEKLQLEQTKTNLQNLQKQIIVVAKNLPLHLNLIASPNDFALPAEFHQHENIYSICIPKKCQESITNSLFRTQYLSRINSVMGDIRFDGKREFIDNYRAFLSDHENIFQNTTLSPEQKQLAISNLIEKWNRFYFNNLWRIIVWEFVEMDDCDVEISVFFRLAGVDWILPNA